MLNRFIELPSTHNTLSSEAARNVKSVIKNLESGEGFNFVASAMMDVAHDLHTHGSPHDNQLAEHMIAGIAKGLKVAATEQKQKPRCPRCGQRH